MEETLQGGYRLNGQSPVKEAGLPVISVITVVYNSLSLIEKTIKSIVGQTYPNIEFIVIDGGSDDGTVEIILLYEKQISYWISEPDRGIYDAMNKGLAASTGDYVWFMNAGDQVYAADTLEKIFADYLGSGQREGNLVYYGDTMIVDYEYREVGLRRLRPPEVLTWKNFKKGMLVCHQAIVVSREIAEPFDPQYSHSADFDWVIRVLKKAQGSRLKAQGQSVHQHIINTHLVLCAFLDGGHSKKNIGISLRERFHSMVRHYGLIPTVLRHIPIAVRFGWYYMQNKRF
ncbi:MAG: glycosyltransferase [Porphyromonadaceae bacterium]|nr:MAG: glycosyltransferase [Porphyromonadaceae bacterium]